MVINCIKMEAEIYGMIPNAKMEAAQAQTDEILGVHIVNTHASELISECVIAMEFRASAEDIARIVHGHPTLSEVVHEAALAVDGRALHM